MSWTWTNGEEERDSYQRGLAVGAGEAVTVPGFVLVGDTATGDYFVALDASGGELLLIAARTENLLLPRDERLGANGRFADAAAETLFVPLPRLVFHLLCACGWRKLKMLELMTKALINRHTSHKAGF